jgi:ribosomal protein S18 acetylase RimI-like enzyme
MLQKATEQEKEYFLSKAQDSANEGGPKNAKISKEKAEMLLKSVIDSGGYYLVHKDKSGTLTGWILVGHNIDYLTNKKTGFLFDLYVLPEHRGKGISKTLIKGSIEDLKSRGFDEVRLNVFVTNFAKEIYKKLGFSELNSIMYIKT